MLAKLGEEADNLSRIGRVAGCADNGTLMGRGDDGLIRARLSELQQRHRDLDSAIGQLEEAGGRDQLQITRLKKEKLRLKDEISKLSDTLLPDIIA